LHDGGAPRGDCNFDARGAYVLLTKSGGMLVGDIADRQYKDGRIDSEKSLAAKPDLRRGAWISD
jgi:hypothetical protein